ncbi:MAG: peptidylprolyl isomerase [Fimbriimonadaceae bacterium]|nr:peptidylprolyl isomerase [Fimbriimonadaceae bacterium]
MMKSLVPLAVLCCFALVGCPSKSVKAPGVTTGGATPVKQGVSKLKKLEITDLKVGDGANLGVKIITNPPVENGDIVSVEYTGKLTSGYVFDTNVPGQKATSKAEPFIFTVGASGVIPGWHQGVLGMKVGGKRRLGIPPTLGYGDQDMGIIPPNSDLYFDIKLLDVVKLGYEGDYDKTDTKLGSGPALKKGDTAVVRYTGRLVNGKIFDSNEKPGAAPFSFVVGNGEVVRGLDAAVVGMKKGGVRIIRIPPAVAYGTKNVEGVPPNSTLVFTIKVEDIQ